MDAPPCFYNVDTKIVIVTLCQENNIDIKLLIDLCEVVSHHTGSGRKEGIVADITECIDRFITRNS